MIALMAMMLIPTAHLALSFVTPWMLAGALLVGLPIAAHLLHRRAKRTIVFPSIELLMATKASQSSFYRLRRWLLLLLRSLAIALIAIAFARPLIQEDQQTSGEHDGAAMMVMVIDRSASTAQVSGGVSMMQAMQSSATSQLDSLVAGLDQVQIIWADARPDPAFAQPTTNHRFVRQELQQALPTAERADWRSALAEASEVLRQANGARRLVIVSDMQSSNWADLDAATFDAIPENTSVSIIRPEASEPPNVAISELTFEPAIAVVGQPLIVTTSLENFSDEPVSVEVALNTNDQLHSQSRVTIQPNSQTQTVFRLDPDRPGPMLLSAGIAQDALSMDNQRFASVNVVDRLPLLIVSDDRPDEPGSASFYLKRALSPRGNGQDRYTIEHRTYAELDPMQISQAGLMIMGRCLAPASTETVKAISQYVENGGSIIWFASDLNTQSEVLRMQDPENAQAASDFATTSAPRATRRLSSSQWNHPLLLRYSQAVQIAIENVTFEPSQHVPIESAQTLMTFDDQSPALMLLHHGSGRVLLARFSPAFDQSDFATHGCFVTFIHGLVEDMLPTQPSHRDTHVGQSLIIASAIPHDLGLTTTVVDPSGEVVADAVLQGDQAIQAIVTTSDQPGAYRLMQADALLGSTSVNIDPRESDPKWIEPEVIQIRLAEAGSSLTLTDSEEANKPLRGSPTWGVWLAIACALLAVEMGLTAWWKR